MKYTVIAAVNDSLMFRNIEADTEELALSQCVPEFAHCAVAIVPELKELRYARWTAAGFISLDELAHLQPPKES